MGFKILHVVPSYMPALKYGGPIQSVHGLCKQLVKDGHDIHIYTSDMDGKFFMKIPAGYQEIDGVKVHYFKICPILSRILYAPRFRSEARKNIGNFDIVHIHTLYLWLMWTAGAAARETKVPYIVSPRGMLVKELIEKRNAIAKKIAIFYREKQNLEGAEFVHATTDAEAQQIREFNFSIKNICVIPNGIDEEVTENSGELVSEKLSGPILEGNAIAYLGRINWKKGLDKLVRAMIYVPSDIRLIIAGNDDDNYMPDLYKLADSLGVRGRIFWTGFLNKREKFYLLRRVLALAVPSINENFGNVVIEAMSVGCPVVVSRGVGLATMIQETGCGEVADPDPKKFGEAIANLVRNQEKIDFIKQKSPNIVKSEYSWQVIAKQFESKYQGAVNGHANSRS